jgi:hypothetical protein
LQSHIWEHALSEDVDTLFVSANLVNIAGPLQIANQQYHHIKHPQLFTKRKATLHVSSAR